MPSYSRTEESGTPGSVSIKSKVGPRNSAFPWRRTSTALQGGSACSVTRFAAERHGDSRVCGRGPAQDGAVPGPSLKTRGDRTQDWGPGGGSAGDQRGWRSAEAGALGPRHPRHGIPEGQFLAPPVQPLTPSANEGEAGHSHFLVPQETVSSGLGGLAPSTGLPDWDPNTHAVYTDSSYSYPASAAEGFPTSSFYPPSDPGQLCPFPQGMEDPLDTRLYAEPSLTQAESWRVSGLLSGPPQLPPVVQGPSLDTARAHMLALGPQQLLAQDEEGDTLLHLFAARGLRWAAYAAAEVLQACRHLDIREHKGKTPLLVAAAANQPLIVEDLLNLGAEPNATDHQGRSVLHVAATYGLPGVLSAVFNSGVRVNLEARDFEGLTPLHTAILSLNIAMRPPDLCPRVLSAQARDRLACVQMLLHVGADHTSQEIKSNKTVLHLAVQAANPTLVQLLLELPRGDLRAFVNMKAHGNTALHMAAALPPGPPQEAIVRRLLAAGADPTLRNLENEQPVHLLRPGPGPEALRQLLKRSRVAPPALSS
ncbi:NF-kappa-B inhibitor delta isoform X1 [Loxodonta africana]|uniref:NF-kappa-B inhibitor delta isoform X1 n=2 Tax=Elephantidae TaxID=9780 RepID=UPI000C810BD9|nr:LOW QUALITY PROTEIN: NF-kappa-B inhibitor delta [Loxodonta africana]